jgi:hypothetical protein
LKARWDELRRDHQQQEQLVDATQQKNIEVSKSAISSREGTILLLKQQAMLDPITLNHKSGSLQLPF